MSHGNSRFITIVFSAVLSQGCSDTPSSPPPAISQIRIEPQTPTVGIRDTLRLTAIATDSAGNTVGGRPITWTSLTPGIVTVDSTGLARGLATGSAVIRAAAEGKQGDATATVSYLFQQIGAGSDFTCAVTTGSQGFCWGSNFHGQLGIGTGSTADTTAPALIKRDPILRQIDGNVSSGDARTSCALARPSAILCWGFNLFGQLGIGDNQNRDTAVSVTLADPTTVTVGNNHVCALVSSGAAYCWGWNEDGQLGVGDTLDRDVPTAVAGGLAFRSLAAGTYQTCAIALDGRGYCWGGNPNREFGKDTTGASRVPRLVSPTLVFEQIAAGDFHACGLTATGAAYCWGGNSEGQLGTGDTASSVTPIAVTGGHQFAQIVAGGWHTCAIATTGPTYCWGYNDAHQLGTSADTTPRSRTPVAIGGGLMFAEITAGLQHTCGRTGAGEVYCWGRNNHGQLGNGTKTGGPNPVRIQSP